MSGAALIIVYNHQYNKNIDRLESIYKDRFKTIYHLMPFYEGNQKNVIPVYENSYYFQGYVAQGLKEYHNINVGHYIFVADDLMLNPGIDETNYDKYFMLQENDCFIPRLDSMHLVWKSYNKKPALAYRYKKKVPGVEVEGLLPDEKTAISLLERFGVEIKPLHFFQIFKKPNNCVLAKIYDLARFVLSNKRYELPYPFVSSYSDIFIVSSSAVRKFCHYCGVFAATDLFAEVSIPTAIALSAETIVTERNLELKGKALWTDDDYRILDKYQNKLIALLDDFPKEALYVHPIKLSKWI